MNYANYSEILKQCMSELCVSEVHGMATALLCVKSNVPCSQWLNETRITLNHLNENDKNQFIALFEITKTSLNSDDFSFELILPDEQCELTERVVAMQAWCQGFLFSFGAAISNQTLSKDAREIIKDMSEVTKLESNAEGEEDEYAYVEIVEYLRAAILILRAELVH